MNDQEFCVHIHPKFDYAEPLPNRKSKKLVFDSKKQKESYVQGEYQFCFVEQALYRSERFENAKQARIDLEERRMLFAKNNGFAPDKTKPNEWTRTTPTEDLLA